MNEIRKKIFFESNNNEFEQEREILSQYFNENNFNIKFEYKKLIIFKIF